MTHSEATLLGDPCNVRHARQFIADQLEGHDPHVVETATLLASELATNSIRHATGPFTISLDVADGTLLIAVADAGPGTPVLRSPSANEVCGRGLRIVAGLADDWGMTSDPDLGNNVWFRLRLVPELV